MNKVDVFWAKILLALSMAVPTASRAQEPAADSVRQSYRVREFSEMLLHNAELNAYFTIKSKDCKKALKLPTDIVDANIKQLVCDSTKFATDLEQQSVIVDKIIPWGKHPDYVYLMYDMLYEYEKKSPNRASDKYLMGQTISKYFDTIRELRLMRYAQEKNRK